MINRQKFWKKYKEVFGKFTLSHYKGTESIFDAWEKNKIGLTDIRFLAYMLATAKHETANTMQPIEEFGKGKNYRYGRKIKHSGAAYTWPDKIYYGRGLVQLTWYENYKLFGDFLKIPLLENPDLACNMDIAIEIMFEGMTRGLSKRGDFTGKSLEMYFNKNTEDPIGARRIINGTDKAALIAAHYYKYKDCLL